MNPPSSESSSVASSVHRQHCDGKEDCQSPSAILILDHKISATDSNIIISKWLKNHPHESRQSLYQLLQSKKVIFQANALLDVPQLSAVEAELLIYAIKENKTLKFQARWYRLSFYPQCFTGASLVNWLVRNNNNLPEEALALGQSLLEHNLLEDICQKRNFIGNGQIYRFNI